MPPRWAAILMVSAAVASGIANGASCVRTAALSSPPRIAYHAIQVDTTRKLLPWSADVRAKPHASGPAAAEGDDAAYTRIVRLAWTALETRFPEQDNGLPTWLTYSRFDPQTFEGVAWPHNPAGLYGMLTESAVLWYAFSGDEAAVALARRALDYQIAHGSTPARWSWGAVPYASAGAGDVEYRGADDAWCDSCGRGDGIGVIEPDKVGELGFGYLQMFELSGEARYAKAAIACADALASHVRHGDETHSPWPFRVYAETNVAREEYSANVVGALSLFEELARLSLGNVEAYARAHAIALEWLVRVPLETDSWSGYFEDIAIKASPSDNPNQYVAMRTARWLLTHREVDPAWRQHVAHLLAWVVRVFGTDTAREPGIQWGATVMSEQADDMAKMGSHTARFGATLALWAEATGDPRDVDRAARSLNWATYMCREDGVVAVGEDPNEGWWFSDGYGDYIRHFLVAMGAVPDWAPAAENHIVRTTSIVRHVAYEPSRIVWTTFDADAVDTLRLSAPPRSVDVDGDRVQTPRAPTKPGEATQPGEPRDDRVLVRPLASGGVVLEVHHRSPAPVVVVLAGAG